MECIHFEISYFEYDPITCLPAILAWNNFTHGLYARPSAHALIIKGMTACKGLSQVIFNPAANQARGQALLKTQINASILASASLTFQVLQAAIRMCLSKVKDSKMCIK